MVFSHVTRKRDTILYPEVPAEQIVPPRFRGRIILTRDPDGEERCVHVTLCGCMSCWLYFITKSGKRRWTLVSRIFPYQLFTLYFLRYV
jgi:NADH-quinone oxidoreductase subunit I